MVPPRLSEATRVPISWLISGMVGVAGIVLYISDMRTRLAITEEAAKSLSERVGNLENDYKTELKSIKSDLQRIADSFGQPKGKTP
jgi:hypothetical protein